jgi:HD superfamily phosphodiesterase
MELADWAEDTARTILQAPLPRRWAHTQGVAAQARSLKPILGKNTNLLVAAAWLHDIGYAHDLVDTGFHPLDGARFLSDMPQASDLLCRLVAHHSCAAIEAAVRGLDGPLCQEFEPVGGELAEALIYCDMTTGPDGQRMSVEQRLAEIHSRYGSNDPVTCALERSAPQLIDAVMRVRHRLANATSATCASALRVRTLAVAT